MERQALRHAEFMEKFEADREARQEQRAREHAEFMETLETSLGVLVHQLNDWTRSSV